MPRPLIGVCAAVEPVSYGVWKEEPAVLLPLSYARAIHGAGGMMAMLPPDRRGRGVGRGGRGGGEGGAAVPPPALLRAGDPRRRRHDGDAAAGPAGLRGPR